MSVLDENLFMFGFYTQIYRISDSKDTENNFLGKTVIFSPFSSLESEKNVNVFISFWMNVINRQNRNIVVLFTI